MNRSALALVVLVGCGAARSPTAEIGALDLTDTRTPEAIRALMPSTEPGVRLCYEAELAATPTLAGRVVASFIIEQDGSVASARISSNGLTPSGAAADRVSACIRREVGLLHFPTGDSRVGVNYPYDLATTGTPL